jgi:sec-independent protein translocase protein TatA
MGLGKIEGLLIVLAIILLLFGAKRIPELARSLGQSVKEVKKGFSGEDEVAAEVPKKRTRKSTKSTSKKA